MSFLKPRNSLKGIEATSTNSIALNRIRSLPFLFASLLACDVAWGADLPVVAVASFESTIDSEFFRSHQSAKPDNFEVMIETQLIKVGRFKVYERNRLDQILEEQGIQESLSKNGTTVAVEGVDYLLYGAITDYAGELKQIRTGQFHSSRFVTRFGVDVKITDAMTGELRKAEAVTVTVQSANAISTGKFSQVAARTSGLAEAQRKAAKIVSSLLSESIFPISVVDVAGEDVYINYGDSILSVGDQLRIIRSGRELIDPQSGKVLGSPETVVGTVRIKEVTSDFSIAVLLDGELPSAGDIARLNVPTIDVQEQRTRLGRKI